MEDQLLILKEQLNSTKDFIDRLSIMADIEDIEYKLGITPPSRPTGSYFECFGCGS